jgi:hypothetical protein
VQKKGTRILPVRVNDAIKKYTTRKENLLSVYFNFLKKVYDLQNYLITNLYPTDNLLDIVPGLGFTLN